MNLKIIIKNILNLEFKEKLFLCLFLSCAMQNLFCADWVITNSGTYILNDDLLSTNADSSGAIRISSSFVTLDLNGRFVYQNNATAGANGVVVDAGLTDVIIKNGTIVNFTRCGITVNAGCSVISLQDLKVESCAIRGIEFVGASGNKIIKSEIINSKIFNCCTNASRDIVLSLLQCTDIIINNCVLSNNVATGNGDYYIVKIDTCNSCFISNVLMQNNGISAASTGFFGGLFLNNSLMCKMFKCFFRNNSTTSSNDSVGFGFLGTLSNFNVFEKCYVINNNMSAGFTGFATFAAAAQTVKNTIFRSCYSSGNSAVQVLSFCTLSPAVNTLIDSCVGMGNLSGLGQSTGMNISSGNIGCVINSFFSYNTSPSGITSGLRISGGSDWLTYNCDFIGNNGGTDPVSNGIRWDSGSNNVFVKNIAARNGSTVNTANIAGTAFPVGSRDTSGASTTMNTPTAPWTNLSINS